MCYIHILYKFNTVAAQISDDGTNPTIGQNYTLICDVLGARDFNLTISSYKLAINNDNQTHVLTNNNVLYFYPLQASDIGQYTCEVNISSYYLIEGVNKTIGTRDVGLPQSESHV